MTEIENIEKAIETIRHDILTALKTPNGIYAIDLMFYASMLNDLKAEYRIAQTRKGWND